MHCEGMHGRTHTAQKERVQTTAAGCCMQVGYGVVPAGQNFQVQTFKTHPWIARSGVNGEGHRLMVEGHMVRANQVARHSKCRRIDQLVSVAFAPLQAAFPEKEDQRFRIMHTPPLPWSVSYQLTSSTLHIMGTAGAVHNTSCAAVVAVGTYFVIAACACSSKLTGTSLRSSAAAWQRC